MSVAYESTTSVRYGYLRSAGLLLLAPQAVEIDRKPATKRQNIIPIHVRIEKYLCILTSFKKNKIFIATSAGNARKITTSTKIRLRIQASMGALELPQHLCHAHLRGRFLDQFAWCDVCSSQFLICVVKDQRLQLTEAGLSLHGTRTSRHPCCPPPAQRYMCHPRSPKASHRTRPRCLWRSHLCYRRHRSRGRVDCSR